MLQRGYMPNFDYLTETTLVRNTKQTDSKLNTYRCFWTSMLEILRCVSLMMWAGTQRVDKEPGQKMEHTWLSPFTLVCNFTVGWLDRHLQRPPSNAPRILGQLCLANHRHDCPRWGAMQSVSVSGCVNTFLSLVYEHKSSWCPGHGDIPGSPSLHL